MQNVPVKFDDDLQAIVASGIDVHMGSLTLQTLLLIQIDRKLNKLLAPVSSPATETPSVSVVAEAAPKPAAAPATPAAT